MSSKGLNFDINNYTINDLKDIFELPSYYDSNIIEIKETKLREKLLGNPKLTPKLKQDTIQFINAAKIKLQEKNSLTKEILNPNPYIIEKSIIDDKNVVQERTLKKHLNVDTRFRDNYNQLSSDFDINLSYKLTNVTKMELSSIEFPTTFYAVSEIFGNNFFTIILSATSTGAGTTVNDEYKAIFELKAGNYSREAITSALNNVDNYKTDGMGNPEYHDSNSDNIFQYINFAVDIDTEGSGTGKGIFNIDVSNSNTNYTIDKVEIRFNENKSGMPDSKNNIVKKLGWMLGFRQEEYISDISSNNFEIKSESLLNITGPKYIYMTIDDYNSNTESANNFYSAFNSVILDKNILARIPLTTYSFSFEVANMLNIVSTPREYTSPTTIEKLGIKLVDEYGRVLNLNEMNISFCLSFTHSYEGTKL